METISVQKSVSEIVGGCSCCTAHNTPGNAYNVVEVSMRNTTFRLCNSCLKALKEKLKAA